MCGVYQPLQHLLAAMAEQRKETQQEILHTLGLPLCQLSIRVLSVVYTYTERILFVKP